MPLSPAYNPATSFANDETNQVAGRSTVRTVALDTEHANIAASINALKTNLELLQRDDGKLDDFLIEPYALAEQTRALFSTRGTPRGLWAAGTGYAVGDVVQEASVAYICYTAHLSAAPFTINGFWIGISADGSASGSATAAAASQAAAAASAATAATQATNSSASAATSGTSATAAANSATAAGNSATAAANSAAAAGTSASTASTNAATAVTKAAEAASSATAAAGSATTAANTLANKVDRTSATGSALLPVGTTAQRDAVPAQGAIRFNATLNQFEGYSGTAWGEIGGGATGAPGNKVFVENDQAVTGNYTISTGKNAMTAGPITINTGVTVSIPDNSVWTIV